MTTPPDAPALSDAEKEALLSQVARCTREMDQAQQRYDEWLEARTAAAQQLADAGVPYTHIGDRAGVVRQVITKQVEQRRARAHNGAS